jgi:hypothetical protein
MSKEWQAATVEYGKLQNSNPIWNGPNALHNKLNK